MTTVAVVQARMGSSRLPGKVLEPIGGVPMLGKVVLRLARAATVDRIVVATTRDPADDPVAALAAEAGADCVRGSELDVLDRFHDVLVAYPDVDVVVRVTADCPFTDPVVVDDVVARLRAEDLDFVATRLPPPARRTYPVGIDVEACTAEALERTWREAREPYQREHVMPYLYDEPGRFRIAVVDLDEDLSEYRWTVDTPEDLEAARALDAACGPEPYGWRRVLESARRSPEIGALNAGLRQHDLHDVDDRWIDPSP